MLILVWWALWHFHKKNRGSLEASDFILIFTHQVLTWLVDCAALAALPFLSPSTGEEEERHVRERERENISRPCEYIQWRPLLFQGPLPLLPLPLVVLCKDLLALRGRGRKNPPAELHRPHPPPLCNALVLHHPLAVSLSRRLLSPESAFFHWISIWDLGLEARRASSRPCIHNVLVAVGINNPCTRKWAWMKWEMGNSLFDGFSQRMFYFRITLTIYGWPRQK